MEKQKSQDASDPVISVIIPTYNRARYIVEALKSVFAQTYPHYEIIVVDDASTDDTQEVLSPYLDSIRYMRLSQNRGVSAARNHAVRESKGKYLAILDSDDRWEPTILEEAIRVFESDERIGLVAFAWRLMDSEGVLQDATKIYGKRTPGSLYSTESLLDKDFGTIGRPLMKRECLDRVGGFDETLAMGEDIEMFLRISLFYKAVFVPEPLYVYREHHGNITRNLLMLRYYALQAVKRFLDAHPDYVRKHSRLTGRMLSRRYANLAKHLLLYSEDIPRSPIGLWEAIGASIRHNPWGLKGYRYGMFALLGSGSYRAWHSFRKKIRRHS